MRTQNKRIDRKTRPLSYAQVMTEIRTEKNNSEVIDVEFVCEICDFSTDDREARTIHLRNHRVCNA